MDRQGWPRLRARGHVGRRRLRHGVRHHGHEQHREDGLHQDRCAHDQRRNGVTRRSLRGAGAGRRVEPHQWCGHPRPRESGASHDCVDVRPGTHRRRAQHVRHERSSVRDFRWTEVRDHRREGHLQAEVRERIPASERAHSRSVGARRYRLLSPGWCGRRDGGRGQRQVRWHDREAETHKRVPDQFRPRDLPILPEGDGARVPVSRRRGNEPSRARVGGYELSLDARHGRRHRAVVGRLRPHRGRHGPDASAQSRAVSPGRLRRARHHCRG